MDPKDYEQNSADDIDLDRETVHLPSGQRMSNAAVEAMADDAERRIAAHRERS